MNEPLSGPSGDDVARIEHRLNQLMSQNVAHNAMIQVLLGMFASEAGSDWRDRIDQARTLAEWSVENLDWTGSALDGVTVRADALTYLHSSLDDLQSALQRSEDNPDGLPPGP